jgi:hypothetical protein
MVVTNHKRFSAACDVEDKLNHCISREVAADLTGTFTFLYSNSLLVLFISCNWETRFRHEFFSYYYSGICWQSWDVRIRGHCFRDFMHFVFEVPAIFT